MEESAYLLAAGLGTRMLPLTADIPKPLLPVHGKPMIETIIQGLLQRHVGKITVVTGYLKDCFSYLPGKYPQIELVWNAEYSMKNNICNYSVPPI